MDYLVVCAVALLASGLTFFSGFGLGTLLLPAFALFFPLPQAVALTAAVHLLNNLFKLGLIGRHAQWRVVLVFGLPAVLAAYLGAWALDALAQGPALHTYHLGPVTAHITVLKLCVALLMALFALWEVVPQLARIRFAARWLPLGGTLSGFFGGLSGHQGALRSAFLVQLGLSKEAFIATGVVLAVLVDLARIPRYAGFFTAADTPHAWGLLAAATVAAFLGAYAGSRLLRKTTYHAVQRTVAVLLLLLAVLLALGWF